MCRSLRKPVACFPFPQTNTSDVRIYTSLANGRLGVYTMTSEPSVSPGLPATDIRMRELRTLTLCVSGFPAKCMTLVGDELWVGCGGEVVVVETQTLDVTQHLRVYSARAQEIAWVSEILCHGDQVCLNGVKLKIQSNNVKYFIWFLQQIDMRICYGWCVFSIWFWW